MAINLSQKFVTSFSELYIRESVMSPNEKLDPSTWFDVAGTNPTPKTITVALAGTGFDAVSGVASFVIRGAGITPDAITFVTSAATTLANLHTNLALKFAASDYVTTAVAGTAPNVITIVLAAAAGDAEIILDEVNAGLSETIATTAAFAAGNDATRLIPNVMEIGTLSNEATTIETPTFGDPYKGKLRGQLDAGQLDTQLYWAPRDSVHLAMREAATSGEACSFGIKWKSNTDGDAVEYVVFDGFLSSFGIDTTFDDVAKASSTMIVDGALYFDEGA